MLRYVCMYVCDVEDARMLHTLWSLCDWARLAAIGCDCLAAIVWLRLLSLALVKNWSRREGKQEGSRRGIAQPSRLEGWALLLRHP